MKVILSALWLLLCLNSWGQTTIKRDYVSGAISGMIATGDSNEPITGATIMLKKQNDTLFKKSVASDRSGSFKFTNLQNGAYIIKIKYVGYQDYCTGKLLISNAGVSINLVPIKLDKANHALNEVAIEAIKPYTEQKIDRIIVNVGQLLSNTGVSAVEVLNNAPGVEVIDKVISLRGKQGVTIYIDGHQTFLGGTELINYLRSLPSGSIEKLELMPNPPVKYHIKGNAGIINIITKKSRVNGFNGSLVASYGQGEYSKSNNSLNLDYKTDKVYFFGNVAYFSNSNYFKVARERSLNFQDQSENYTIGQDNFETNNQKSTHYKLGLDATLNTANSVGFTVDGMTSPYHENGNYLLQFSHLSPDSVIRTNSDLTQHTQDVTMNVYYEHKFKTEGEDIRIDADYLNYQNSTLQLLNSNTYLPENDIPSSNYNLLTQTPFRANVYSLKTDYETKVLYGIKLSAGLQAIYSKRNSNALYFNTPGVVNDSLSNSSAYTEHINSAYLSLDKAFNKLFSLSVGLRFENSNLYAGQFTYNGNSYQPEHSTYNDLFPKLYMLYKLDPAAVNTLNFSFGSQISHPDYSALNPFAFYFDRYTILQGNAALQPARDVNFDLSFTHSGLTIGTTYSKGNNTIIQYYYVSGQSLVNTSVNVPDTYDLEIYSTIGSAIFKWWRINLFNELSDLSFKGIIAENERLNTRVLTYRLSGNNQFKLNDSWSAELSGNYRTKTTLGQGYYLPICRINAGLQKKVFKDKGIITLSGADIFHSWKIRKDVAVNNALITVDNLNDTQQVNLTFTYRFGTQGKSHKDKSGLTTERNRAGAN